MSSPLPPSLKETLLSYLEGQKVSGNQTLPWNDVLPGEKTGKQLPPPPPPKRASPPPLDQEKPTSALPAAPVTPSLVTPTAPKIFWMEARRHQDCITSPEEKDITLLVVSDREEFNGEPGKLLLEMLHAIGFIPSAEPSDMGQGLPESASRVLILGNHALQSVSDAGVDLQLIRGLWQSLHPGRSLATYAPSAVTDSPSGKKTVWGDLQTLLEDLSLDIPEWTRKKLKRT